MPTGCIALGPSYTIDGNGKVDGAFPLRGVKDAAACASLCQANSKCAAFHYYGIGDYLGAYGECYLHSAGRIMGPLHDSRDCYAGQCGSFTLSNKTGITLV
jgi:hypothetical protein